MKYLTLSILACLLLSGCGTAHNGVQELANSIGRIADAIEEELRGPTTSTDPVPTPEEIQTALDGLAVSANGEVFALEGPRLFCQALDCIQGNRIYVRGWPSTTVVDTSDYQFMEARNGVSLAEKESRTINVDDIQNQTKSLAGWLDHNFFLVEVEKITSLQSGRLTVYYFVRSIGDSTGTNPTAPAIGTVTWAGVMAGFVGPTDSDLEGSFVDGDAAITLSAITSGSSPTVDVLFSNIIDQESDVSLANISWTDLHLTDGAFGSPAVIEPIAASDALSSPQAIHQGVYGRFYGPNHEEVGGAFRTADPFDTNGITGVFGAKRGAE